MPTTDPQEQVSLMGEIAASAPFNKDHKPYCSIEGKRILERLRDLEQIG